MTLGRSVNLFDVVLILILCAAVAACSWRVAWDVAWDAASRPVWVAPPATYEGAGLYERAVRCLENRRPIHFD